MGIVRKHGKPDLFITKTCNPKWLEITSQLEPGQCATDRPDITSRVFRAKLKALTDLLYKKHIMGRSVAHIRVCVIAAICSWFEPHKWTLQLGLAEILGVSC